MSMYIESPLPVRIVTASYIWAVAWAVLSGARVLRADRIHSRKTIFTLDDTNGLASRALEEWRFGSVNCDPRDLIRYHANLVDMAKGGR